MKALTLHSKQSLRYETVRDPQIIDPTDVIVRVERTAICGSDMHVYHDRERGIDPGTAMGHEFVGEVVDVGAGVRSVGLGDRVFTPFTTNCGDCPQCRRGLTSRCVRGQLFGWVQNGEGLQGAQAELVRVPLADSTLVVIPEGVTPEEALLLGDVFSTGYFCARSAGVKPDGVYAVVGCGPVGLMAVVGARELGAELIYALDSIPERLEKAAAFGATAVDIRSQDARGLLLDATEGIGADAVLEVVGSPAAGRAAYELVRPGGTISVVGVHNEEHLSFSPTEAYDKNLTFTVGRCPARAVMQELIPVVRQKKYDIASIFTHRMGLSEGVEAYKLFDEKRDGCTKVVLTP
jgi:threonine dehydrogenase-like Zn-dependent dehydrogenase